MKNKTVICSNCDKILYVITKEGYIVGNLLIKHGFTGFCSCGKEFNSEWIPKESEI